MFLHYLQSLGPAKNRMALFAVTSHPIPVYIRMTVRALLADRVKHGIEVTETAFHILMRPSQGIAGILMVKIWCGTYRGPTDCGMTV